ncbi:MAG: WecB/TagA/CpsF family glycosyltransferase [Pseudohongiella sp.]|nr:WecB/TagA/CpsF family glycosyltransferase [Pseudohongiella sp.]
MTSLPKTNPTPPTSARWQEAVLRAFDSGLAIVIGLLASPLILLMLPGARLRKMPLLGRHETVFNLVEIELNPGFRQRLGRYLRICRSPVLLNILLGDMAWSGPRALTPGELPPEAVRALRASVRPGLFSLWSLRQRTCIDYGDEWGTDVEQISRRSLRSELGIMVRSLLAAAYGRTAIPAGNDPIMVDTVRVHPLTMSETLDAIDSRRASSATAPLQICFVNPDCVNIARRNPAYRRALNQADLVAPDGIGMRIAGKMLGKSFRQNVNGTDLFPRLCERLATDGGRLYLLGGHPGVAEQVAAWIGQNHPGVEIAGMHHGYFNHDDQQTLIESIRASRADVLLVAMGAPQQDLWIQTHAKDAGVKVAMGVGGLFDFYANRIPRAPQWLREMGLEWTFRLYQEPRRMWRRYLVGNFRFLLAIAMQRWLGSIDVALLSQEHATAPATQTARRAVVIATHSLNCAALRDADINTATLPLGDRPLLYRQLETLADLGCREIELFASHGLASIRTLVGAGERWGLTINVHAVRDFTDARRRIVNLDLDKDELLWMVRADQWLPAAALQSAGDDALWFNVDADGLVKWTGWARFSVNTRAAFLSRIRATDLNMSELPSAMSCIGTTKPFGFESGNAALEAQSRWLNRTSNRFDLLQETSSGIRIAAGAHIAPGARLIAPVEVGANSRISAAASVGPDVVIGEGCRIDGDTRIRHSVVADGVRIKGPVEVDQAIVTTAGLLNTAYDVWLPMETTGDILSASNTLVLPRITMLERLTALLAFFICLLPVLILRILGRDGDFSKRVFPQLLGVLRGQQALIGTSGQPDLPETIHASGWSQPLQKAPKGLISPRDAFALVDDEAAAWADVHWLLHASWKERLRLLRAYISNHAQLFHSCVTVTSLIRD